jgi:hypothetical protein
MELLSKITLMCMWACAGQLCFHPKAIELKKEREKEISDLLSLHFYPAYFAKLPDSYPDDRQRQSNFRSVVTLPCMTTQTENILLCQAVVPLYRPNPKDTEHAVWCL